MLDVEVIGSSELPEESLRRLVAIALASAGVDDGHVAIEFVDGDRIRDLNREFRGKDKTTDVLSFPIDEVGDTGLPDGERELGDVVISPEYTEDLREAVVHGVLHLVGMDHEVDDGEMLALQREILTW